MKKITSAGILFLCEHFILLGHSTGNSHWDIPKGMIEDYETALEAAIRETYEETNIIVSSQQLHEIGIVDYRHNKQLHLFYCEQNVDPSSFQCHSFFYNHHNKLTPEIDDLAWFDLSFALKHKVSKNMRKTLNYVLSNKINIQL